MGLKEHWVEFTQETSLNGWYFIGALFSLKKYFQQRVMNWISQAAMLAYQLISNLCLPRPRKLCSSPEIFLACCRHFICRWCHCFQSVKLLNIVTIMFNHNIFSCGIDFKQPILHFMQICYIGASWLSSLRQQFSSLWGLEVWNWCDLFWFLFSLPVSREII